MPFTMVLVLSAFNSLFFLHFYYLLKIWDQPVFLQFLSSIKTPQTLIYWLKYLTVAYLWKLLMYHVQTKASYQYRNSNGRCPLSTILRMSSRPGLELGGSTLHRIGQQPHSRLSVSFIGHPLSSTGHCSSSRFRPGPRCSPLTSCYGTADSAT